MNRLLDFILALPRFPLYSAVRLRTVLLLARRSRKGCARNQPPATMPRSLRLLRLPPERPECQVYNWIGDVDVVCGWVFLVMVNGLQAARLPLAKELKSCIRYWRRWSDGDLQSKILPLDPSINMEDQWKEVTML